jgi:DNA-binding response OmpR family regulator
MSATTLTSAFEVAVPSAKKKRVLLVDTSRTKRDLRSETMRKLGIEVDCAADVAEARSWWRVDLYDLVLFNIEEGGESRDKFCDDIRNSAPRQQIMFLVGKPEYLAAAPGLEIPAIEPNDGPALWSDVKAALAASSAEQPIMQRWGILEACRKISAVRSISEARSRALRERPLPPRDFEVSQVKRAKEAEFMDQSVTENTQ